MKRKLRSNYEYGTFRWAVRRARKRGSVVVIGHHYFHGTFDCLKESMPRYRAEGVEFVKASQVVR